MRSKLPLAVVALLFAVAGCSFSASIGAKKMSSADLEREVASQAAKNNLDTSSVDCPAGLEATVGAVAQCELIANDLKYTATAKTTSVDGDSIRFDLDVPPPAIIPKDTLEAEVGRIVEANSDFTITTVTCDDELPGTTGTAVNCEAESSEGDVIPLVVTVTEADFLNVNFKVDERP